MWRQFVKIAVCFAVTLLPSEGISGDLSAALEFVRDKSNRNLVGAYIKHIDKNRVSLMGLLEARDIQEGKALEDYDCVADGRMDRFWQPKYSKGEFRLMARYCVEQQFKNKNVRGFRTLGKIQLSKHHLKGEIHKAAQAADIPPVIIREIITLSSGFRPGAISDDGKVGLMQLKPHILKRFGANNPYDAIQNIRAGAQYFAHLMDKWDNVLPLALAEYKGASASELANGGVPTRRSLIWWVRAITKQYKTESAEFPTDLGWENIALVASWLN